MYEPRAMAENIFRLKEFLIVMARYQIKKSEFAYFIGLLFLTLILFCLNSFLGGYIANPENLAYALDSPPQAPQVWGLQTRLVFKYRLLFRWIVQGTWFILFSHDDAMGFYYVYVFYSFIFFYASLVSLYFLLKTLDFSESVSFAGCLLFLLSPPIILAYMDPVCTREDPLAYFLVILVMIAIIKLKPLLISILLVIAGLVRETTHILLPVYLLVSKDSLQKKVLVCIPPFLSTVVLRIFLGYGGVSEYIHNPSRWSVYNIQYPFETISFLFLTFGILWLPSLARLTNALQKSLPSDYAWEILIKSTPIALLLILGSCIILARPREMRITYLLFPWIIPLALDWFRLNIPRIKILITNKLYWAYTFFVLIFLSFITMVLVYIRHNDPVFLEYFLGSLCNKKWLVLGFVHLLLTLTIILPLYVTRSKSSPKTVNIYNSV